MGLQKLCPEVLNYAHFLIWGIKKCPLGNHVRRFPEYGIRRDTIFFSVRLLCPFSVPPSLPPAFCGIGAAAPSAVSPRRKRSGVPINKRNGVFAGEKYRVRSVSVDETGVEEGRGRRKR